MFLYLFLAASLLFWFLYTLETKRQEPIHSLSRAQFRILYPKHEGLQSKKDGCKNCSQ